MSTNVLTDAHTVSFLDSAEDTVEFMHWLTDVLESERTICLDTETTIDTHIWMPEFHCRLWQIGTSEEAWCIPAQQWHRLIYHAMEKIASARCKVIFANPKFDQHVFFLEGWPEIPWHRVEDVVTYSRLYRSFRNQHGLKYCAGRELGEWAVAGQDELTLYFHKHNCDWSTIPLTAEAYWVYGGMDCIITVLLYEVLADDWTWWCDIEHEYIRIVSGMERRGIKVDRQAVEKLYDKYTVEIDRLALELKALGFSNPSSSKIVQRAFEDMGYEPEHFSELTGDPSYNKMVLKYLESLPNPKVASAARYLIEFRHYNAWRNNYTTKLLKFLDKDDILRASINTMQARTGRMSVTDPPLQTIPKAKGPRNLFVAREGHELWAIDYSSQEVRVMAALSGDVAMMNFFDGAGGDYHQYVAELAGIPRSAAKTVNYARAYGAGADTMARTAGCSVGEMEGYLSQIDAAFPRSMQWKDEVTYQAEQRRRNDGYPWVQLPYGRVAALIGGSEFTQGANTEIQGHGADVIKYATCRIAAAGLEQYILLPVHDENVGETPAGEGKEIAHEMARLMEDNKLQVPLTTDITGPMQKWGEGVDK